jgi:hypothetical protein
VIRIMLNRSNRWLIGANVSALAFTLYLCAFVNFAEVIASYNLAHSSDGAAGGIPLDIHYLVGLGPQAIPAIDLYIARRALPASNALVVCRNRMAATHGRAMEDWRAWTFRGWRLQRYLESQAAAKGPVAGESGNSDFP